MNGEEVKGGEKAEREGMMIVTVLVGRGESRVEERGESGEKRGIEDACSNRYWPWI